MKYIYFVIILWVSIVPFIKGQTLNAYEKAADEAFEKQVVIEEYIEGREISVESISFNGIHYILAVTDKITTGPPYFVELEHHQPSSLSKEQLENVHRATIHCLDALYIKYGASHAEFKLDKDFWILASKLKTELSLLYKFS
jgi:biotin carboxylase